MLTRRGLLLAGAFGAIGPVSGCALVRPGLASADVPRRAPSPDSTAAAVDAVGSFGADLLEAVAQAGNVVCSPFSVLFALAMVRNGATGQTAREMDATLHLPRLDALNAGLNALDQTLATRAGRRRTASNTRAKVHLDLANRVWGQRAARAGHSGVDPAAAHEPHPGRAREPAAPAAPIEPPAGSGPDRPRGCPEPSPTSPSSTP